MVVVVQVDRATAAELSAGLGAQQETLLVDSPEQAVLAFGQGPIDALVLGLAVAEPTRLAQRLHAIDRDAAVVILADSDRRPQIVRALQFSPFLGDDVVCLAAGAGSALGREVAEAAGRARRRRRFRSTAAAVSQRLAAAPAQRSQPLASQYLGRLLEYAPIGVVVLALAGDQDRILGLNRHAGTILGKDEQSALGASLIDLFDGEERDRLRSLLTAVPPAGPPAPAAVLERRPLGRAGGQAVQFLETTVAALSGRDGEPGLMVLLQDVTQRVTAERSLQHALRTRDEFISSAAHDLKTPVAGIKGLAQYLNRRAARAGTPETQALLQGLGSIDRAATRMTALINELLDVTRLQLGRPLELDRTTVDLVDLARRSVADLQQTAQHHHFELQAGAGRITGFWDEARLHRVLDNLLNNAVKYSPKGGTITVTISQEEEQQGEGRQRGWAVLSVRDEGIGIPAADQTRVFERFQRATNVVGSIEGTGIGLASAQHIVRSHGGAISVVSTEGQGSTFTVRIPLIADEAGADEAGADEAEDDSLAGA